MLCKTLINPLLMRSSLFGLVWFGLLTCVEMHLYFYIVNVNASKLVLLFHFGCLWFFLSYIILKSKCFVFLLTCSELFLVGI